MDLLHRFFQLHRLLDGRRVPLPRSEIEAALECSTSTAKRLLGELRNYGAPIEVVPGQGYLYRQGVRFQLPGLGLSSQEISALLLARQMFSELGGGGASPRVTSVRKGVAQALASCGLPEEGLDRYVRVQASRARMEPNGLPEIMEALLKRLRVVLVYRGRGRDEVSRREIAPQRLKRYRDNWYLDAWCYLRRDLRSFAVERIVSVEVLETTCDDVADEVMTIWGEAGYGIFNGPSARTAVLRFSKIRSRWAADESWHPRQEGAWLSDGRYELRVPYSDPIEISMDILRLGDDVEVVAPEELRTSIKQTLEAALRTYRAERRELAEA